MTPGPALLAGSSTVCASAVWACLAGRVCRPPRSGGGPRPHRNRICRGPYASQRVASPRPASPHRRRWRSGAARGQPATFTGTSTRRRARTGRRVDGRTRHDRVGNAIDPTGPGPVRCARDLRQSAPGSSGTLAGVAIRASRVPSLRMRGGPCSGRGRSLVWVCHGPLARCPQRSVTTMCHDQEMTTVKITSEHGSRQWWSTRGPYVLNISVEVRSAHSTVYQSHGA
jgi:hypothetical protein